MAAMFFLALMSSGFEDNKDLVVFPLVLFVGNSCFCRVFYRFRPVRNVFGKSSDIIWNWSDNRSFAVFIDHHFM